MVPNYEPQSKTDNSALGAEGRLGGSGLQWKPFLSWGQKCARCL